MAPQPEVRIGERLRFYRQDRASILKAMNQAVTRLYVQEDTEDTNGRAA
jgi:hypothetical protein